MSLEVWHARCMAVPASNVPASKVPASKVPAYKEWAVVVRALLAGEQLLDLRKGGLHEAGRHFGLHADRFWLYPTYEHQRPELLKPAYRRWVDESAGDAPAEGTIRIDGWAEVVGVATLSDPEVRAQLDSKLIWSLDYVESRLRWKRRDPLWVLALRTHRLRAPITVDWRPEYAGCTSWVELAGLPADPTALDSEPALSDGSFASRLRMIGDALGADAAFVTP
jgi:hypothetical protein